MYHKSNCRFCTISYFKFFFSCTRKSELYYILLVDFGLNGCMGGIITFPTAYMYVYIYNAFTFEDGASFHLKPLNLKYKGSLKCAQVLISLGLSLKISKQQTHSPVYMNRDRQYCAFAHLKLKACAFLGPIS